jgi:hypothetical protein
MPRITKRLVERMAALLLVAVSCPEGFAMNVDELVERLRRAGADELRLVESNRVEIDETKPDFLRGASFLRVTVREAHHPHVLHYVVAPGGALYRPKLGQREIDRMQTELELTITDEDAALRYVQWLLALTQGTAFWPVADLDDVPFMPAAPEEAELLGRIEAAKASITRRIEPPRVRPARDGFLVTQTAVRGRDFVRYEVRVTHVGRVEIETETLERQIPVVYVFPG